MKILLSENPIINTYFEYAMEEIASGIDKETLRDLLFHFEEQEEYLACAGVHKAILIYEEYNNWLDEQSRIDRDEEEE
tara:strand:+ start:23 stop:256 length:234 start_codon:yes stop_codon:yes gene_type:complete